MAESRLSGSGAAFAHHHATAAIGLAGTGVRGDVAVSVGAARVGQGDSGQ